MWKKGRFKKWDIFAHEVVLVCHAEGILIETTFCVFPFVGLS